MKNKLWIYGCSFSDCWIENRKAAWWNLLSDKLNLECINRAYAGFGWSFHQNLFYSDIDLWSDEDVIIVENSFLTRMYPQFIIQKFEQFKYWPTTNSPKEQGDELKLNNLIELMVPIKTIVQSNYILFHNSLKLLQKLKQKWFFWTVENYESYELERDFDIWDLNRKTIEKDIYDLFPKNALLFENGIKYYKEWMNSNPSYCIDLNKGDIHQNQKCHKIQADLFYNQIKGDLNE